MDKLVSVVRQARRLLRGTADVHMDDTATELELGELLERFEAAWNDAREDRWITDAESDQLCRLWLDLKALHARSLAYNREVQHELESVRQRLALGADERRRDPDLGQVTIGQYLRSSEWPDAA